MGNKVIKVAWICSFSNSIIRNLAPRHVLWYENFFKKNNPLVFDTDFGQWNTNGIIEMEKHPEVELHVLCPVPNLTKELFEAKKDNIYYHFFKDERITLTYRVKKRFFKHNNNYTINRKRINTIINSVSPDIVHIIGAENDFYSKYAFDIPSSIPLIVQLQTLINDPIFKDGYVFNNSRYEHVCKYEAEVLKHADYIGTSISRYRDIIKSKINPNAKFIDTILAVGPRMSREQIIKKYDCVYFSANLNKAGDLAVEAFIRARRKIPSLTMIMIGAYSEDYKDYLTKILKKNGAESGVTFTGRLSSYMDVLSIVQSSKCALIPLKVDYTSSTIREAMALSVPTLSTITEGTPILNQERLSILLSPIGDHNKLADNLVEILTNDELYSELKENGYITIKEKFSNEAIINKWVESYKEILNIE